MHIVQKYVSHKQFFVIAITSQHAQYPAAGKVALSFGANTKNDFRKRTY